MGDRPPRAARAREGARRPRRAGRAARGLAILTCSGGDSGLGADEAERLGLELPAFAPATAAALRERLPADRHDREPARLHGDDLGRPRVAARPDRASSATTPASTRCSSSTTTRRASTASSARAGRRSRTASSTAPTRARRRCSSPRRSRSCSTTPPPGASPRRGVPAVAGLRAGLACAAALQAPPPDAARLREMAAACRADRRRAGRSGRAGPAPASPVCDVPALARRWLAEHEAKALLRAAGIPVVDGRVVAGEDDAVAALAELGGPVAVKLSSPELRHKTAAGALALDVADEPRAARRLPRARRPQRRRRRCSSSGWRRPAPS